jgi:hypothetical protein
MKTLSGLLILAALFCLGFGLYCLKSEIFMMSIFSGIMGMVCVVSAILYQERHNTQKP